MGKLLDCLGSPDATDVLLVFGIALRGCFSPRFAAAAGTEGRDFIPLHFHRAKLAKDRATRVGLAGDSSRIVTLPSQRRPVISRAGYWLCRASFWVGIPRHAVRLGAQRQW